MVLLMPFSPMLIQLILRMWMVLVSRMAVHGSTSGRLLLTMMKLIPLAHYLLAPASETLPQMPPPFLRLWVHDDYFCDTGSRDQVQLMFYGADPLWDGAGCGPLNTCCSFNKPPWFYKQLPQPTTDDIELRVCRYFTNMYEDIAIAKVDNVN